MAWLSVAYHDVRVVVVSWLILIVSVRRSPATFARRGRKRCPHRRCNWVVRPGRRPRGGGGEGPGGGRAGRPVQLQVVGWPSPRPVAPCGTAYPDRGRRCRPALPGRRDG